MSRDLHLDQYKNAIHGGASVLKGLLHYPKKRGVKKARKLSTLFSIFEHAMELTDFLDAHISEKGEGFKKSDKFMMMFFIIATAALIAGCLYCLKKKNETANLVMMKTLKPGFALGQGFIVSFQRAKKGGFGSVYEYAYVLDKYLAMTDFFFVDEGLKASGPIYDVLQAVRAGSKVTRGALRIANKR